jgi:hypothetical protein
MFAFYGIFFSVWQAVDAYRLAKKLHMQRKNWYKNKGTATEAVPYYFNW